MSILFMVVFLFFSRPVYTTCKKGVILIIHSLIFSLMGWLMFVADEATEYAI